jgi:hypothetical protein
MLSPTIYRIFLLAKESGRGIQEFVTPKYRATSVATLVKIPSPI